MACKPGSFEEDNRLSSFSEYQGIETLRYQSLLVRDGLQTSW